MAAVRKKAAVPLAAKVGHTRSPTTLRSVRPGPLNCVWRWRATRARWAPSRAMITAGSNRMWMT